VKPCSNCTHPSAYVCQPGWPSGPELPVGEECPCECHQATEGDERPAQEAKPGDLVMVRLAGSERLAVLLAFGESAWVRIWRRDLGRFEHDAVPLRIDAVLRLAPDDDTTAGARAALAGYQSPMM
jgi:hypothetical protein